MTSGPEVNPSGAFLLERRDNIDADDEASLRSDRSRRSHGGAEVLFGGVRTMNDDEFAAIAHKIRKALDSVPQAELPESMAGFPAGCCHGASILLGTYLGGVGRARLRHHLRRARIACRRHMDLPCVACARRSDRRYHGGSVSRRAGRCDRRAQFPMASEFRVARSGAERSPYHVGRQHSRPTSALPVLSSIKGSIVGRRPLIRPRAIG
jgi:hypothetical protein